MKVKQVFSEYPRTGMNAGRRFVYCPMCRTKCVLRQDGGRERPACPQCGFIHYKNPAPAVSVLIVNQDQVLLGKRAETAFNPGLWCLPCGFIEFDEDF